MRFPRRLSLLRCPFRISARIHMGAVIVAAASAKRPITLMRTRTSRYPRVCIPVFGSAIRSSVSERCCLSSSWKTTSSCSCGSIRWARKRFAPSTRSSKWSVSLRCCGAALRLNRRDDPAPVQRLAVLLAGRALERHHHGLRRGFTVRSLHLCSHRDGLADDGYVHAGHVDIVAAGRCQAGNGERFFLRDFLTCL